MNLIEGLQKEIKRNQEILKHYEEIPAGRFAAVMIRNEIEQAEKAMGSGDCVAIIRCLKTLQGE